ncbi:MAG: phosphoribosylglycinamide formyltransferase [Parcubacteria group bacterium]|nr:phosphoribosylglycinamide formyltransferase [Parcubacteria group bacterium]
MLNIAVGLSGQGTTFEAIQKACLNGKIDGRIQIVFTDNLQSYGIQRARNHKIPVLYIPLPVLNENIDAIIQIFKGLDISLICLAGFLKKIPSALIHAYRGRVINSHPALLPKYGGKGMYGERVHEAVLAANEQETGCTIHFVDEEYDHGDTIVQKKIPVLPDDTVQTLRERLLPYEHQAYIEAIQKLQIK